jgi:hypothetical protein
MAALRVGLVPHSSRERPGDVKKRLEWLEHRIAAGSEIGPENTLKVETRVQVPLG